MCFSSKQKKLRSEAKKRYLQNKKRKQQAFQNNENVPVFLQSVLKFMQCDIAGTTSKLQRIKALKENPSYNVPPELKKAFLSLTINQKCEYYCEIVNVIVPKLNNQPIENAQIAQNFPFHAERYKLSWPFHNNYSAEVDTERLIIKFSPTKQFDMRLYWLTCQNSMSTGKYKLMSIANVKNQQFKFTVKQNKSVCKQIDEKIKQVARQGVRQTAKGWGKLIQEANKTKLANVQKKRKMIQQSQSTNQRIEEIKSQYYNQQSENRNTRNYNIVINQRLQQKAQQQQEKKPKKVMRTESIFNQITRDFIAPNQTSYQKNKNIYAQESKNYLNDKTQDCTKNIFRRSDNKIYTKKHTIQVMKTKANHKSSEDIQQFFSDFESNQSNDSNSQKYDFQVNQYDESQPYFGNVSTSLNSSLAQRQFYDM